MPWQAVAKLVALRNWGSTMRMFGFGHNQPKVSGSIGYFGLSDWWFATFSESERQYIQERFQPLGSSGNSLTSGEISFTTGTDVGLLQALAGWFTKPGDRSIALRMLRKAEDLVTSKTRVLDVHFLYGQKIEIYYKDRENPESLDVAIAACRQQIELAPEAVEAFRESLGVDPPPAHRGYEQLAIVLEKQGKFGEAIDLCAQAARQGWAGNWEIRIQRCRKKQVGMKTSTQGKE